MYLRNLVVVALCIAFVAGFVVVLNYEQSAVIGSQNVGIQSSQASCQASAGACDTFSLTSVTLQEENYSSELGPGSFALLTMQVKPSGAFPIDRLQLFIDNASAGTVQGPFQPGVEGVVNVTLPATITVAQGKTYTLAVQGLYDGGSTTWQILRVTAE